MKPAFKYYLIKKDAYTTWFNSFHYQYRNSPVFTEIVKDEGD